jgi:transcriptional regulator with XRE-family HTH domain
VRKQKRNLKMVAFYIMPHIAILSRNITGYIGFIIMLWLDIYGVMPKPKESQNVLLGRRIRSLRIQKGWTQQKLGEKADINYKFLGEIERGQQNPSFGVLAKIATALGVDLPELFRFEHEMSDRKEIEASITHILRALPDQDLSRALLVLRVLYPIK